MKRDWILLLVALGLAWGWVKSYGDRRASGALAEARGDSLRLELASGDSIRGLLQAKALALDSMKREAAQHYQRDRRLDRIAALRADSTAAVLDSLIASLPDTTPLVIAITNEREAGAACHRALNACDSLGVLLGAELANRDSVIAVLQPSLARVRLLWESAEKRSRPGLFGRIRAGLPFAAAGLLIGAVFVR